MLSMFVYNKTMKNYTCKLFYVTKHEKSKKKINNCDAI